MRIITCIGNILVIVYVVTCLSACLDEEDQPFPPISNVGAGTFGCRINGKQYVPFGWYSGTWYDQWEDWIVIYAGGDSGNFSLIIRDSINGGVQADKTYFFDNEEKGVQCRYNYVGRNNDVGCEYYDKPVSGYIKFSKVDLFETGIVSGVFEFTSFSQHCNKTVTITDGRFDLK